MDGPSAGIEGGQAARPGRDSGWARALLQAVLVWTLALLLLGSVVHATGSSLACPDWPTCFGTMMPEMEGGVFWEHLHRLWAGALVILFAAAVIVVRRTLPGRRDLFTLGLAGIGLLLFQSVLGGLTVIYRLPDAISTSHLAVAFIFLALATVMLVLAAPGTGAAAAHPGRTAATPAHPHVSALDDATSRRAGLWAATMIFAQSIVGALVRHTDAGMGCPDVPLCLGRIIPPLVHPMVQLHFLHRVLGLAVAIVILLGARKILAHTGDRVQRRLAVALVVGVVAQIVLGFASVAYRLAPPHVSAHTLLAAVLLMLAVAMTTRARRPAPR